ncbi:MAG: hypothetical protein ACRC3Z_09710 [Phocaeicola sp.]
MSTSNTNPVPRLAIETFEEYLEELARQHPDVQHQVKNRCHFSYLSDDAQTKLADSMHYPCVVADSGNFGFSGQPGNILLNTEYSVLFLQHVSDTGDNREIRKAFSDMKRILLDFAAKFSRDKRALKYKFLNRFSLIGGEGHRIYMQDNALYGYALLFNADSAFTDANCNNVFND